MTNRIVLASIVAVALAGCAATGTRVEPPVGMRAKLCDTANCPVVPVSVGRPDDPTFGCMPTIPPDFTAIEVRGQQDHVMQWELDASAKQAGYKFDLGPKPGVVINSDDPWRVFHTPVFNDSKVIWHNKNSNEAKAKDPKTGAAVPYWVKYTINVVDRNGAKCQPLDPWVMNN